MKSMLWSLVFLLLGACKKEEEQELFGPYWDVTYSVTATDAATRFAGEVTDGAGALMPLGDTARGVYVATPWIYSEHYTKNPYAANTYDVYLEVHGKSGTGLLTARISVDGAVVREGVFVAAEPVKLFYHLR